MRDIEQNLLSILGHGRRVSKSKEEWTFTCPKCDERGHLHISLLKGVFICVTSGCGYKGHIQTLLGDTGEFEYQESAFPLEEMEAVFSYIAEAGSVRDTHLEFLSDRGIQTVGKDAMKVVSTDGLFPLLIKKFTIQDLEACGLVIDTGGGMYQPAQVIGSNRILILYSNPLSSKYFYGRSRYAGSSDIPYLAPAKVSGNRVTWGWENVDPKLGYLVVTEGEFKAQASKQAGVQCVALPGLNSSYEYFGEICLEKGITKVCIIFDTEGEHTKTGAPKQGIIDYASNKLSGTLKSFGVTPYRVELPLLGYSKMDIDTYLLLGYIEEYRKLVKKAKKI